MCYLYLLRIFKIIVNLFYNRWNNSFKKLIYDRDKSRLGCPIARSTGYCVRYHLGSLAFGSLLIALMKLVRLLFSYLERKLKGAGTDCCGMIKCLTCFCKCCLYCFEKFLQAICSNAYIEIGSSCIFSFF